MLAEVDAVPAGSERRSWLMGALWLVARRARILWTAIVALLAAGAGVAVIADGWHGDWENPATPVNRVFLVSIVIVLVALPIVCGRVKLFGPGARNAPARVLRVGGYLAICALPPIVIAVGNFAGARLASCGECSPAEQEQWHSDRVGDAISGSLVIFVLISAFAVGILLITSRRVSANPAGLTIGGSCAVFGGLALYGLSPTGATWDGGPGWLKTALGLAVVLLILATPTVAGLWATNHTLNSRPSDDELKQGILAGALTASVGALLVIVLTIPTMLIFPLRVPLKWANPSSLVPHGTVFEIQMSVGDAAVGYEVWLLLAPLIGAALGAVGCGLAIAARRRLHNRGSEATTGRLVGQE